MQVHSSIDYLGLNAALYEWAESYDSKVSLDPAFHTINI